mmetsp:Transcript_34864/g.53463  ORF Transcript_34864/g.53463 Transcript_34864/m.53463 type:complete len:171 (-) Transcript_34864:589-1101(-)
MTASPETAANARKRRRDIICSQRSSTHDAAVESEISTALVKKRRVSLEKATEPTKKRVQMRYDPEVPMSKEEAAAWRREQRRKRNRESAAASRQRQRDRIAELEEELDEWKAKYSLVLEKLKNLEEHQQEQQQSQHEGGASLVSPVSSPNISPQMEKQQQHLIEMISRPA